MDTNPVRTRRESAQIQRPSRRRRHRRTVVDHRRHGLVCHAHTHSDVRRRVERNPVLPPVARLKLDEELLVVAIPPERVTVDSYVLAGSTDHIFPWQACYRSGQLFGGKVRFVLSTSGHVAALVNPPTNPKASFRVADDNLSAVEDWDALRSGGRGPGGRTWPRGWGSLRRDEGRPPVARHGALPRDRDRAGSYALDS